MLININIDVDDGIEKELKELSQYRGKSTQQLVKELFLEALEDAHDAALGDAAMRELEQGKDSLISFDDWIAQNDD